MDVPAWEPVAVVAVVLGVFLWVFAGTRMARRDSNRSIESIRQLSAWAWCLACGSLVGPATVTTLRDGAPDPGIALLYAGMGAVGLTLLATKDYRLGIRRRGRQFLLLELAVLGGGLAFLVIVPTVIGSVRGILLAIAFVACFRWYSGQLDALEREANTQAV